MSVYNGVNYSSFVKRAEALLFDSWTQLKHQYPNVPFDGVLGICAVENTHLNPQAHRFESQVFQSVMQVKMGRRSNNFPGFNDGLIYEAIKQYEDESLHAIANSWGLGQIMGYHLIQWGIQPEEYMNHSIRESLNCLMRFYTELLPIASKYSPHSYEALLRMWNTGSPIGKTYDPNYVSNALSAARSYAPLG
jgi:hypothetical protein